MPQTERAIRTDAINRVSTHKKIPLVFEQDSFCLKHHVCLFHFASVQEISRAVFLDIDYSVAVNYFLHFLSFLLRLRLRQWQEWPEYL